MIVSKQIQISSADFLQKLNVPSYVVELLEKNGHPDFLIVSDGKKTKTIINNSAAIIELTKKQMTTSGNLLRGLPKAFVRSAGEHGILATEGERHLQLRTEYLKFFRYEAMSEVQSDFVKVCMDWFNEFRGQVVDEEEVQILSSRAICIGMGMPLEAQSDIRLLFNAGLARLQFEISVLPAIITILTQKYPKVGDLLKLPFTWMSNIKLFGTAKKILSSFEARKGSVFEHIQNIYLTGSRFERLVALHMFIHIANATTTFTSVLHSTLVELGDERNRDMFLKLMSRSQKDATSDWMGYIFSKAAPVEITGRLLPNGAKIVIDGEEIEIAAGDVIFALSNAALEDYNFAFFYGTEFCLAGNSMVPVFIYSLLSAYLQQNIRLVANELQLEYGPGYIRKPDNAISIL